MKKQPRCEITGIPGKESLSAADLLAGSRAPAETAQFLIGWLDRPRLTGKPEGGVRHGNGIFASGSSSGYGLAAGGLTLNGYQAPGKVTGLQVLADPDPSARKPTTSSRRITLLPGKGKDPVLQAVVETWTGSGWKRAESLDLVDAGAFVTEGKTTFWEVWLSPGLLGVEPFTKVAVAAAPIMDGKARWGDGEDRTGPASWHSWDLR